MKKVKAVMMAGGFGTRIQPLTHSMPKPMLPVVNIPMMEHILKKLKKSGIDEVVILLYYMPDVIKNHFKDGSEWGVRIDYVLPDGDYGTAGAVGFAREFLDTTFMVVSGDLVTDFDFKEIIDFHFKRGSKLTITLTSVENPLEFGIVITDENGKIEKFLEKPSWGEVFSDTINTGIYVIEPEILDFIPKNEPFDFSKNLFPLLMEKGINLLGFVAKGYWRDVGNPDSYREVHHDIFHKKVKFNIPGDKIIYEDGVLYLQGRSEIPDDLIVEGDVVIGDGVKLGKNIKLYNCVIGDNTEIKDECNIKNSILWKDVRIGKRCKFDNCVICNDVEIGDLVEAKAGAVIAEGCKIGKFTKIEQDVTIWPNKEIEPASIVKGNVVFGTKYKSSIFNEGIISGIANIEISCDMACKLGEAFASQLPKGSTIVLGRDFEAAPRMIKRAFLGGILASGVNVVDLKAILPSVLRYSVFNNKEIKGGAYFRKNLYEADKIEIILFNEEGLRLNKESAKKIEKTFFQEKFRKVDYDKIGEIYDDERYKNEFEKSYVKRVLELIDNNILKGSEFKAVFDLMWGMTQDIFPRILKNIEIENILLNAYYDSVKISNITHFEKENKENLSDIVKCLGMNIGFLIYPQGQRLSIIGDDGSVLDKIDVLNLVLYLYNEEAKSKGRKLKVFLPSWAPDFFDEKYSNLTFKRGKYSDFKAAELEEFDLIATVDGNFAFSELAYHRDAIYASIKIIELLIKFDINVSDIEKRISRYYYGVKEISCPQSRKGKVIRKFIEYSKDKKHSTLEGVKVFESDDEWVLMIPDAYEEKLNVYIQARDVKRGEEMFNRYKKLIKKWIR